MEVTEIFLIENYKCGIVEPHIRAVGNPWVWRAEFFGAFDYADRRLLQIGWCILYYSISDMYGCPKAVDIMKKFHDIVVDKFNLNPKADLFGFSRGGLYSFNYALQYPEDVSVLYLDAPVLDIKSWPAGWGKGCGDANDWEKCKEIYDLDDSSAREFKGNPIDNAEKLIKQGTTVILVAGDADTVVPLEENGALLQKEFIRYGKSLYSIIKAGVEHHPHSLEDPTPITDFISKNRSL